MVFGASFFVPAELLPATSSQQAHSLIDLPDKVKSRITNLSKINYSALNGSVLSLKYFVCFCTLNNNLNNKSDASHTHTFSNIGLAYKDYDIELPIGYTSNTIWAWATKEALACTMVYSSSQATEPCICMINNEYVADQAVMIRIQTASSQASINGGEYRVRLWYVVK